MSIATLARKSRAQRGASARSGWTLATNANGGGACHGPCNGTAPAKQKSFRLLMKNKQQGGGPNPGGTNNDVAGGNCCFTTWKEVNNPKGNQAMSAHIARKKQYAHNCSHTCIPERQQYNENYIYVSGGGYYKNPDEDHGGEKHYPPLKLRLYNSELGLPILQAARNYQWWGARVDEGGSYYDWRVLYNPNVLGLGSGSWIMHVRQIRHDGHFHRTPHVGRWLFGGNSDTEMPPKGSPSSASGNTAGANGTFVLSWNYRPGELCHTSPCNNIGCKCNCSKGMGGVSCCNVHKTMLPLSNSENIPWVIKQRTCLKKAKAAPRNPNTC